MKGKMVYAILLAGTVFWGILYYSSALISLAVLEILAAVFSFLILQFSAGKIKGKIEITLSVTEKGEQTQAGLELENPGVFPVPSVETVLVLENLLYGERDRIKLAGSADGKSKVRFLKQCAGKHCGPVRISAETVWVWDYLRIFRKKLNISSAETWIILPERYTAMVELQEETRMFIWESEEYDKEHPGDDVSEVFQLREYRPGDRMQSIHWKRSAGSRELIVRDYSHPVGNGVLLFLDMKWKEGFLDDFLETGLAVSAGLLEAECSHYAVYLDAAGDVQRMDMKQEEDLYTLIDQLFHAGMYSRPLAIEEMYREKYRGETYGCVLRLDTDLRLWKNQEVLLDLSENPRRILERQVIWI